MRDHTPNSVALPKASTIRAKIIGDTFKAGDTSADSLPRLCVQLLVAGCDSDFPLEAYAPRSPFWAVRVRSLVDGARNRVNQRRPYGRGRAS